MTHHLSHTQDETHTCAGMHIGGVNRDKDTCKGDTHRLLCESEHVHLHTWVAAPQEPAGGSPTLQMARPPLPSSAQRSQPLPSLSLVAPGCWLVHGFSWPQPQPSEGEGPEPPGSCGSAWAWAAWLAPSPLWEAQCRAGVERAGLPLLGRGSLRLKEHVSEREASFGACVCGRPGRAGRTCWRRGLVWEGHACAVDFYHQRV